MRAAGIGQTLRDTLVNMNAQHLGGRALTVFESLADAGLRTAAVNFTAYRGRTRHRSSLPFLGDVLGPERFFFYNLFSSDRTGAPLSWRNRPAGSIDAYATAVGRWLVTRDAFDFLVFYLSDYDYASHEHGPDTALEALQRCDDAIGSLAEAGGGIDALLERYAVVVMADHGQTRVHEAVSLAEVYAGVDGVLPLGVEPGRARLPRSPAAASTRGQSRSHLDGVPAAARWRCSVKGAAPWRDARARSSRFAPATGGGFTLSGDASILDHPDALARPGRRSRTRTPARSSSRRPKATSSPTSAAATTSAAARTAPSSPATPRCRSSRRRRGRRRREHRRRRTAHPRPFRCRRSARTRSIAPPEPLPSPNVIEPSPTTSGQGAAQRVGSALGRRSNWEQLGKFCIVGASGYVVNLAVYAILLEWARAPLHPRCVGSFLVAVANNYA